MIVGDIGLDLQKILRRLHIKIENAPVTRIKQELLPPCISKKELFEEHKNNWVDA